MIDYIKIALERKDYEQEFLGRADFYNLKQSYHLDTGEVGKITTGYHENLTLVINPRYIVIAGSIHKYHNIVFGLGDQNHTDFKYGELCKIIRIMEVRMKFDMRDALIQNMEFGVNIGLSISPTHLLKKNVILQNYKEPSVKEYWHNSKGCYNEYEWSQYYLKVYDKGIQYGLSEYVLRIEIKTKKSEVFTKGNGKWTLQDLLDRKLHTLKALLLRRIEELLIVDDFDAYDFDSTHDYKRIKDWSNPKYWTQLYIDDVVNNRRKYYRHRKRMMQILKECELISMKDEIISKVNSKWDSLMEGYQVGGNDINI